MDRSQVTARALSLGVSGVIWVGLGALMLTQAPKLFTPPVHDIGPVIGVRDPVEVTLPPPPEPEPVKRRIETPRPPDLPRPFNPAPDASRQIQPIDGLTGIDAGPQVPVGPVGPATDFPADTIGSGPIEMAPAEPAAPPPTPPAPPPEPPLVINPVRLAGPDPAFPQRALEAGRSGVVTLAFMVGTDGRVSGIEVIEETPGGWGFARAARAAIARWSFEPQRVDGAAVPYQARYTIRFELAD